jgi:hypothetical protein
MIWILCEVMQGFRMIPEVGKLARGPETAEMHKGSHSGVVIAYIWFCHASLLARWSR